MYAKYMHICFCWVFLLDDYVYGGHEIGVKLLQHIFLYVAFACTTHDQLLA